MTSPAEVRMACIRGLEHGREHALESDPSIIEFDVRGFETNIVSDLRFACGAGLLGDWLDDLLEEYMTEVQSSAALAVNCFGPLLLAGIPFDLGGQRNLRVHSIARATRPGFYEPDEPALYVIAEGPGGTVVIDVSCLDYLTPPGSTWADSDSAKRYAASTDQPIDRRFDPANSAAPGGLLDVATLLDRARAPAGNPANAPAALTYVYWEPLDAGFSPLFEQHREELAAFAKGLGGGGGPRFEAISCFALWDGWAHSEDPHLRAHVAALRARYEVPAWAWECAEWRDGRLGTANWMMDLIEEVDAERERKGDQNDR